jgi:glycosyltransferase involved in cell wall biosynthesis
MTKLAIILTSIERPQALKKSVESIIANWQEGWYLFVGLQDSIDSESWEIIAKIIEDNPNKIIRLYDLDYNCGISKARNELILHAALWDCKYTLLTADSITFDKSMQHVLLTALGMDIEGYKLCGLNLNNRIPWEANLDLLPERSFQLDFIDPSEKLRRTYVDCRIVRNFWIARTDALLKVPYDEHLVMCEHEDFFWRMKLESLPVCCTNVSSGTYYKIENTPEYDKIRTDNFRIGMQRLKDKYSLKSWVSYVHLERTHL